MYERTKRIEYKEEGKSSFSAGREAPVYLEPTQSINQAIDKEPSIIVVLDFQFLTIGSPMQRKTLFIKTTLFLTF